MSTSDESPVECLEPAPSVRAGIGLAALALLLPVLAGSVLFFVTSAGVAFGISLGTVFLSALLLAIDARRLGNVDLDGRRRESATALFAGMIALWIVFYPLVFFRRRHFGGPNLGVVAILVALFFVAGP